MDVAHLTFEQFLEADAAAARSTNGQVEYEQLQAALLDAPKVQERLALEMVRAGSKYVAEQSEIGPLSSWIRRWSKYVGPSEMRHFMLLLEALILQYFESFERFEISFPEVTLPVLLNTISENQPDRLDPLLRRLKAQCGRGEIGIQRHLIEEFEKQRKRRPLKRVSHNYLFFRSPGDAIRTKCRSCVHSTQFSVGPAEG
jgi:hypothetical protein